MKRTVPSIKISVTGYFIIDPTEYEDFDQEKWDNGQMSIKDLLEFMDEKMQEISLDDMDEYETNITAY